MPDRTNAPGSTLFGHLMWDNTAGYSFVLPTTVCANSTAAGMPDWWSCTTTPLRPAGDCARADGCCSDKCQRGRGCQSCALELGVEAVVEHVRAMVPRYKYGQHHVFMAHGSDFMWADAPKPYQAMEMIMTYVNARPDMYGLRLVYSSPAAYFAAIQRRGELRGRDLAAITTTPGAFAGDFFPATFSPHYVRAGFFSSRPASKALDRAVWARGDAAKRLRVLSGGLLAGAGVAALDAAVAAIDAAVGVHQHHDAMSGTDLVAVADNYRQMMIAADELAVPASASAVAALVGAPAATAASFAGCVQSNVSVCPATAPLQHGKALILVLFNPLGSARSGIVAIPVPISGVTASSVGGGEVASEVHEALYVDSAQAGAHNFTLFVNASLPPLGTLRLHLTPAKAEDTALIRWRPAGEGTDVSLAAPGGATATVDSRTGALAAVAGRPVLSSLEYYTPNDGSNKSHHGYGWSDANACSSAYAFLPQPGGTRPFRSSTHTTVMVAKGSLVQQTHTVVDTAAGVELAVRVAAGDASVQLLAKFGPLDVSNGFGQEAVLILDTCSGAQNACPFGRSWLTDANGLQMIERAWRDNSTSPKTAMGTPYTVWEPEAQNYYPATSMAALQSSSAALTVAFDAAHGVTSRSAGALELMMHRRIVDRGCRNDEGYQMDDAHPVVSELRVQAPSTGGQAAAAYRADALHLLHPVLAYVGPPSTRDAGAGRRRHTGATARAYELPTNVHLHTLRALGTDLEEAHQRCDPFASLKSCASAIALSRSRAATLASDDTPLELIVRFQHLYAAGEDPDLSQPATVNMAALLSSVLPGLALASAVETTLVAAKVLDPQPQVVLRLLPLQIRTFVVEMKQARGAQTPATDGGRTTEE